ncbi:MAG: hypothetical protein LBN27_04485 [Prevotellaceae bacterium]|jgi:hypothetical protein|nr:hypothetical protein [Prevotellaceae bacterium]
MTIYKEISHNGCKLNTLNLQVSDFLLNTRPTQTVLFKWVQSNKIFFILPYEKRNTFSGTCYISCCAKGFSPEIILAARCASNKSTEISLATRCAGSKSSEILPAARCASNKSTEISPATRRAKAKSTEKPLALQVTNNNHLLKSYILWKKQ